TLSRSKKRCGSRTWTTRCPSSSGARSPTSATGSSPSTAGSCTRCTPSGSPGTGPIKNRQRPLARASGNTTRTVIPPSTKPSSAWFRSSPFDIPSSTVRGTSARSTGIRRRPRGAQAAGVPDARRPPRRGRQRRVVHHGGGNDNAERQGPGREGAGRTRGQHQLRAAVAGEPGEAHRKDGRALGGEEDRGALGDSR